MSKLAKGRIRRHDLPKTLMRCASIAALGVSVAVFAAGTPLRAQAPAQEPRPANGNIPELASTHFAWLVVGVDWLDPPPGLGRGPIRADPAHPYVRNRDRGQIGRASGRERE